MISEAVHSCWSTKRLLPMSRNNTNMFFWTQFYKTRKHLLRIRINYDPSKIQSFKEQYFPISLLLHQYWQRYCFFLPSFVTWTEVFLHEWNSNAYVRSNCKTPLHDISHTSKLKKAISSALSVMGISKCSTRNVSKPVYSN